MDDYDGWEIIGKGIGEGGQGTVFKARKPQRSKYLRVLAEKVNAELRFGTPGDWSPPTLAELFVELGSPDSPGDLGALKQFKIPTDDREEEKRALGRLETEIHALEKHKHAAILKLLHDNLNKQFIVTEYHPYGTLDKHLHTYKGKVLEALIAFRPIVDAVRAIHSQEPSAIHRDIKPENIFVASDGGLVLGDFGIVIFKDSAAKRLTTTFERVGSHFWMAPWAYDNVRLVFDAINPTLDIYPLGKVLWSMIAGRNGFPYWEFKESNNDLELLFPGDPLMAPINNLLSKCVVRYEKDCRLSAADLLAEVDQLIAYARYPARRPMKGTWHCNMCGTGEYVESGYMQVTQFNSRGLASNKLNLNAYICDACGHVQIFKR